VDWQLVEKNAGTPLGLIARSDPHLQEKIESMRNGVESVCLIPIILTSDKTHLSQSGKAKAWPLYLTIGNLPSALRLKPEARCVQLVALLPVLSGNDPGTQRIADFCEGIETHRSSKDYSSWFRGVIHTILRKVLEPLEKVMRTGIRMVCGDGKTRLCFPVLCEYIADMEEQWLLTCLINPSCPKCPKRKIVESPIPAQAMGDDGPWGVNVGGNSRGNARVNSRVNSGVFHPRTDVAASRLYDDFKNGIVASTDLHRLGYHPSPPFSHGFPFNGILDAVCPDLLHGVSKCFHDYVFQRWIYPVMTRNAALKNVTADSLAEELDARFAIMPVHQNVRRFANGVLSQKHSWSVYEFKAMMKVIVGVLTGLCPPNAFPLLLEYLHIHYIAHYSCHTAKSLAWLDSAVQAFFKNLYNPSGPFVQFDLVEPDYAPQRLHYFLHYSECVREKGSLPSYSTQMTEIHHKPIKQAYRRSNKRPDDILKFVLEDMSIQDAFATMIDSV
jgi:hypothetical protein